jgi:putative oxidoreductase
MAPLNNPFRETWYVEEIFDRAWCGTMRSASNGGEMGERMSREREGKDLGLLVLRIGIGVMFILVHGGPKVLGGPERWAGIGGAMAVLGITAFPVVWGLAAACAEFLGGIGVLLGLWTRWACGFLAFTMAVAATMHLTQGDGWGKASHAIEVGTVFISLLLIGPGAYSLDHLLRANRRPEAP